MRPAGGSTLRGPPRLWAFWRRYEPSIIRRYSQYVEASLRVGRDEWRVGGRVHGVEEDAGVAGSVWNGRECSFGCIVSGRF